MTTKRVNVLVYSGAGSTIESVRHCLYTFRRLLSPNYAVTTITAEAVLKEPWSTSCALFIMPGGADLGYCRVLNGEGNRRITQYVNRGGAYLGLCAGGYYGSARCEFMIGDEKMEVVGDRELGFFPGVCRGLAFPGFVYASEAGARACEVKVNKDVFATAGANVPETVKSYFNGGGVFVDAEALSGRGVEVLASFTEPLDVESGEGTAAVVYRKIGDGHTILSGTHPEFAAVNLSKRGGKPEYAKTVETLHEGDKLRVDFLKACLRKMGLTVNETENTVPSLSLLHLTSVQPTELPALLADLSDIITRDENGQEVIKGANDTFILEKPSGAFSIGKLKEAVSSIHPSSLASTTTSSTQEKVADDASDRPQTNLSTPAPSAEDAIVLDYDKIPKRIFVHEEGLPSAKETPYFNHSAYFSNWAHYVRTTNGTEGRFGKNLIYGEVVTSTSTMLDKNPSLLQRLHWGVTTVATTQLSARGRGNNVWVSPPGAMMFSTIIRHPMDLMQKAPVVFVQYLAALAVVRGIQTYGPPGSGYASLPIKLKWPNDIYAQDPAQSGKKVYVKVGGILVNSSYSGGDYNLVLGIGLNLSNAAPTTSLNALVESYNKSARTPLEPLATEKLLARILTAFESIYSHFCQSGWTKALEEEYYKNWLHTDQIVSLETEGGSRCRVKGITRDWGMLLVEEVGWEDRGTGKVWQLQSDSNSFDFFKGLVRRKI